MHRNEYRRMAHEEVEEIFREILPQAGMKVREEQITLCHQMLSQPVWKQDCIMRCSSRGRKDLCIPGSVHSFSKIQSIVIWIFFYVRSESAYCDLNLKHCIAGSHPKRIYTFFITGFIEERNHICPYPSSHPKRERTFCM